MSAEFTEAKREFQGIDFVMDFESLYNDWAHESGILGVKVIFWLEGSQFFHIIWAKKGR